jgi:catechol 2,3-dioxygenase-like lactoylglutathione lyase family enzyme
MKIHHLELNTADLDRSHEFYKRMFEYLGCERIERSERHFAIHGNGWYLYMNQCSDEHARFQFDRYRPGLNHVAFAAADQGQVDVWHEKIVDQGIRVLDPPGWYGDNYYAVYFEDPDGMKLELGWESSGS